MSLMTLKGPVKLVPSLGFVAASHYCKGDATWRRGSHGSMNCLACLALSGLVGCSPPANAPVSPPHSCTTPPSSAQLESKNLSDVSDVRQTAIGPNSRTSRIVTHCHTINCSITAVTIQSVIWNGIHVCVGERPGDIV